MEIPQFMSPHTRAVALCAACLATFQAVCWGILALLAVIGYDDCTLWSESSIFLYSMQYMYFQERNECSDNPLNGVPPGKEWVNGIMGPGSILAWMIILLSVNCVWFFASLSLFAAWKSSKQLFTCSVTSIWCAVTAGVLVVDLVACAMFGADYGKIIMMDSLGSNQYLAPPAVIMTLAARGFVLWFINLALLAFLVNSLPDVHRQSQAVKEQQRQLAVVDLYGPPAPGHEAYNNQAFTMTEVPRSSSAPPRGYHMYPNSNKQQQNIPRPDYSPFSGPMRHLGVARANSQQHRSNSKVFGQKQTGF